tara:strand:+ start:127 stop:366 length:240 start_codon:yes stop_codon:yes gene_type:complete
MVYVFYCLYNTLDGYDYGDDMRGAKGDDGSPSASSYWGNCPICKGPLEEVYYGGGVTKHECKSCVKNFVTSIYNDPNDG